MTGTEFVKGTEQLETYYQKKLEDFEKDIWYRELGRMSYERFNKIIQQVYTRCKFMPKLADIFEINKEIPYTEKRKAETKQVKCKKCNASGIIIYKKIINNHEYDFAARCTCENGNKYIYNDGKYYIPSIAELGI